MFSNSIHFPLNNVSNTYIFIACDHSRTSILLDIVEWMNRKKQELSGDLCFWFAILFYFIFILYSIFNTRPIKLIVAPLHVAIKSSSSSSQSSMVLMLLLSILLPPPTIIVYWKKRINHIFDFETTEQSTMRRKNTELCRISFENE